MDAVYAGSQTDSYAVGRGRRERGGDFQIWACVNGDKDMGHEVAGDQDM